MEEPVVIVGAGHGGSQAAFSLRQEGFAGPVLLLGDEPHLPYHRPPLSKTFLKEANPSPQILRAEKAYIDAGIDLLRGVRVTAIDRQARRLGLAGGGAMAYGRLILATGARNRTLSVPGHDIEGVFGLRTLADAEALREAAGSASSVAVVGGGFVGLETAATFAALGKQVTVLEAAPRILGRAVAPALSAHIGESHRKAGVDILTGVGIDRIDSRRGRVCAVILGDGRTIPADLVLVGIGALPNDGLARDAGLACDNGVCVDAALQTSDTRIHAIGDVASYRHWHAGRTVRLESVQNAVDQAKHVARAILGRPAEYRTVPWFWSDQGPLKLQMAGLSFDADRHVLSGEPEENAFSVYHFGGERLLAVDSLNRPAEHMLARRMLETGFNPTAGDIGLGLSHLKERLKDWADVTQRPLAAVS